ncbi:glycosyltransferase family 2 protein [Loktanella sp. DJP18]|uniref:glycosyltransferase family 2 protein n=1 Tax=Loktanella sp. DJP18 TaxID=3409788 RepID=UPI003BB4E517
MPRVSIITPLYNGAKFVAANIKSVQAQSMGDYEHIIIDNGSTDDGATIARQFAAADDRIVVLENKKIKGAAATRNVGLAAACGRYIAFLDSDDTWMPDKLERQTDAMARNNIAFSWTSYQVTDGDGDPIRTQYARGDVSFEDILKKNVTIGCLTVAYDASVFGHMRMGKEDIHEDFCLWIDILTLCQSEGLKFRGIDGVLASYRTHTGTKSSNKIAAAKLHWRSCRKHLGMSFVKSTYYFVYYVKNAIMDRSRA